VAGDPRSPAGRDLERRGPDDQTRRAAASGRIEGLGVNGLAAAVGCSHTTALRHLRHLESLGLIRTEQAAFTLEADQVTGRIRRNYAKAPPKVIVVTIEDRHCRPCRAPGARRQGTPETGPRASGGTPETGRKGGNPQARNWRVSKERTSKEVRSFGTNKRRTAAGLGTGPAAAAAAERGQRPAGRPEPADEWAQAEAARRAKERQIETFARGLQISAIEVIALMRAAPDELRRIATDAGILTPDGHFVRPLHQPKPWRNPAWTPPPVSPQAQAAIKGCIEEMSDHSRLTNGQIELINNATKATKAYAKHSLIGPSDGGHQPASPEDYAEFVQGSKAIMAIRKKAEASGDPDDLERAREESLRIVREYAKKLESGKAVA